MGLIDLRFNPGIVREVSPYSNENGWVDCDKIRFRGGFPESIGGWARFTSGAMTGAIRSLHSWTSLSNENYVSAGTNVKLYVVRGSTPNDITPLRETTAAGDVTFSASDGSTTLTVTDTAHGASVGDYVTFSGAVTLGGVVTADILNAEYTVATVSTNDVYTVELASAANASDTGNGGASVVGAYQVAVGLDTAVVGTGWGAGGWGEDGWGEAATTTLAGAQLRLWTADNYGEDLFCGIRDGGLYYWDETGGVGSRAVALSDLPGANLAPTIARQVMTSDRDRHALAFGCDPEDDPGAQDPLLIRFSAQENIADWQTTAENTAGSLRISTGSAIVSAVKTRQQVVVITDKSVHALQYVGAPFTFGLNEISVNTTIAGPMAAIAANDVVYWMGQGDFYVYSGSVQKLPCSVREYVFSDINVTQAAKTTAGHNSEHSEIWWFYPSAASATNDKYVVYNYAERVWYYGTMARTAWEQRGVFGYSLAAATDGYLYYHETGNTNGEENPATAISSFIESAPVDIGQGDQFMFMSRILPDVQFRNSTGTPSVDMTLKAQNAPGGGFLAKTESETAAQTATVPVEQFTEQQYVRLRGRAVVLRVETDVYNTEWRLGTPRLDIRTDGRRG